jgi:hypothetical protein
MERLAPRFDPALIEQSVRQLWASRGLPGTPGSAGPADGAVVRQLLGTAFPGDPPVDRLLRAVAADVAARYLVLTGARAVGVLAGREGVSSEALAPLQQAADRIGAWTSLGAPVGFRDPEGADRLQRMADQLARSGLVNAREFPLRTCPSCRSARTPETIVYQSERGPAYLVRFRLRDDAGPTSLLVWVDAPWKLLGTSALLVNPELSYATAVFQRRGVAERIIAARSVLPRLTTWLPDSTLEVVEERPGARLVGAVYEHPLATESPQISTQPSPAGTVLASSEVGDSGTGIVGLVPRHGASDFQIARTLHLEGITVVDAGGRVAEAGRHKYSALPLDVADAFILRDLRESGLVFADLTVQRGVPYCVLCGSTLLWLTGRSWSLDLGALSAGFEREFSRLLPDDPLPPSGDVVPWPVSDSGRSARTTDPQLSECDGCERVYPVSSTARCPCGSPTRTTVRRRLLPAFSEVLATWAGAGPSDGVQLYVPDRRRVPSAVHQLVAREASGVRPGETRLLRLPTMPADPTLVAPDPEVPVDARRAAFLRSTGPGERRGLLGDRLVQESRRLRRLWQLAHSVIDGMITDGTTFDLEYCSAHLAGLPEEDRAFLSRFERLRAEVRGRYEALDLAGAQERLVRFMEEELREGYLPLARPRIDPTASPGQREATFQLLARVLYLWAELYAPIAPFTMEAIVQAMRPGSRSVFERGLAPGVEAMIDPEREKDFDRWAGFALALSAARREVGLPSGAILPQVVLLVADDGLADTLARMLPTLGRVGRIGKIEIDSPNRAWPGRRIDSRPNLPEIQRVYGTRAGRIFHLLERVPARKALEGLRAGSLNVVLDGETVRILPGMLEFTESLPECVVPVPWQDGEILLIDPRAGATGSLPSLSLDGLAIVRHIDRRLRRPTTGAAPSRILTSAQGSLAEELRLQAPAISLHFNVGRFEVIDDPKNFPPSECSTGRTRRGERWAVWIPGNAVGTPRSKSPRARPRGERVRPATVPAPGLDEFSPAAQEAYDGAMALSEGIEREMGRPLLGPAKAAVAWQAGFRSVDDLRRAPFEAIAPLSGFGHHVAAELVRHFGGRAPERAPRLVPTPVLAVPLPEPAGAVHDPAPPGTSNETDASRPRPVAVSAPLPAPPPGPAVAPSPPRPVARPIPAPPVAPAAPAADWLPPTPPIGPPMPAVPTVRPEARPRPVGPRPFTPAPEPAAPASEPPARPGGIEVWTGPAADRAWGSFMDLTEDGRQGLCITRDPPGPRRSAVGQRAVQVVWLSNIPLGPLTPTARPGDLEGLERGIRDSIADHDTQAVYLEGVEYLSTIHGASRLTASLSAINETAREHGAIVLMPLRPGLLDPADLSTIAGSFRLAREPETAEGSSTG